jgi:hypothetical protein
MERDAATTAWKLDEMVEQLQSAAEKTTLRGQLTRAAPERTAPTAPVAANIIFADDSQQGKIGSNPSGSGNFDCHFNCCRRLQYHDQGICDVR